MEAPESYGSRSSPGGLSFTDFVASADEAARAAGAASSRESGMAP